MNNDFKQKLQEREFLALKDSHHVILKWATGCGKSKMTIDLINNWLPKYEQYGSMDILFVVAERAHIKNWEDELDKWSPNFDTAVSKHITIMCYNSLSKAKNKHWDVIVFDEAHHMFTEKRMAIITEGIYAPIVYMLSATLSSSKIDMAEEIFGKFTISTVTLKDAIASDILPDPKVYVIGMELDNTKRYQEIRIGDNPNAPLIKWEDRAKYIYKNIPCIIQCTEAQKNLYMTTTMEYWKQRYERSHSEFQRTKWVNMGSQRKRFLGELKTNAVRTLIAKLPKRKRYVCFCASVNQANALSSHNTISSKKTSSYNQGVIDKFNKGSIDNIYAVGMITEGMNLTNIEAGIIVQLDGKERLFIQKFGRVCRAEDPVTFIFYYKNTQDENYLKEALENIDAKYVKHISINQLNNIKL